MRRQFVLAFLATAAAALAHYTWIAPIAPLEAGKLATIRIGHGHRFPQSEEAINVRQIDLYAIAPSGLKTKLEPTAASNVVAAAFTPKESGPHRIVMTQDRGISSRTPGGVKRGGRDANPDATQSYRTFRSAVAYAGAVSAKRIGLELELTAELSSGAWNVQLLKQGKPAAGISVSVFLAGSATATDAGKTGPDGKLRYQPPSDVKGPAMFSVEFKDPAPAGAPYDTVNYESSLYVNW